MAETTVTGALSIGVSYLDDPTVKGLFSELLDKLGVDLETAGYEPSSDTEDAQQNLLDAVNDVDERKDEEEEDLEEGEKEEEVNEEADSQKTNVETTA